MKHRTPRYSIDPMSGAFTISEYNWAPPFSDFLPGIAGHLGVPCWVFWVNRAQAVSAVGVGDRDGQIMELNSFNTAAMRVAREGFRTLMLVGGEPHEPFTRTDDPAVSQTLKMTPWGLKLSETHERLGIEVEVEYAGLPTRRLPGLMRRVAIANQGSDPVEVEWIDGAPRVIPGGVDRHGVKTTARHAEAMFAAFESEGSPVFRLKQTAADRAQIGEVHGGTFYVVDSGAPVVVDPEAVFADAFDFDHPDVFFTDGAQGVLAARQIREGRTPCALAVRSDVIPPAGEITQTGVLGHTESDSLLGALVVDMRRPGFASEAFSEARRVVSEISDRGLAITDSPAFDGYLRQNFLDNVLRGGMPSGVEADGPPLYVFWRQNADLERDYHEFELEATYLSQGMSHFRNVLQNRRSDPWFFPGSGLANIEMFAGLIQLDGYNPLEVRHTAYRFPDPEAVRSWAGGAIEGDAGRLADRITAEPMTPGALLGAIEDAGGDPAEWGELLPGLLALGTPEEVGGREAGFWIDHWHYLLDMIEAHLAVHPDGVEELLLRTPVTYFDNPDVVLPRSERIFVVDGRPRQLRAVAKDEEKADMIESRTRDPYRVRGPNGELLQSSVLVKLLLIAATRVATIDPSGLGVEMEAGKPGWNDSLNGLPALFGSGLSETIELRRLLRLLGEWLEALGDVSVQLEMPEELARFIGELEALLAGATQLPAMERWRRATVLKERYRESIRAGSAGVSTISRGDAARFVATARTFVESIFEAADDGSLRRGGVPHTYFINEIVEWEEGPGGVVEPTRVEPRSAGLFLEGPMHWMREFPDDAAAIYESLRRSALWDEGLGMYRISERISGTAEMGRAVGAYPRGWLENESIYTHMEYKYLLEVLRSGLAAEFWRDARTALTAFGDPAVYGRSPLQGVSFIVSTAHPSPAEHGRGYQPRLSGMTAEMLSIWLHAVLGPRPFRHESGRLVFAPRPSLPRWLFTTADRSVTFHVDGGRRDVVVPAGSVATRLLGDTLLVITNPRGADTFGPGAVTPRRYRIEGSDGSVANVEGAAVPDPQAEAIRAGNVDRIEVMLDR